jgi:hypothetical protein
MNNFRQRILALLVTLLAALSAPVDAAPSKPQPAESAAAKRERAERDAVEQKQKALAEERGVTVETQPQQPVAIIDVPQDETDSPGSVTK